MLFYCVPRVSLDLSRGIALYLGVGKTSYLWGDEQDGQKEGCMF